MLSFPCACPIANRALHAALLEDPPGQATVPTDECYVVRAETLDGAEVVSTVADIDNALVLAVGMALLKCVKLIPCTCSHCILPCTHAVARLARCVAADAAVHWAPSAQDS